MPIIRKLVRTLNSGIGLATEAVADHKEKKAAKEGGVSTQAPTEIEAGESATSPPSLTPTPSYVSDKKRPAEKGGLVPGSREVGARGAEDHEDSDSSTASSEYELDTDRAEWALDDAAAELERPPPSYEEASAAGSVSAEEVASDFLQAHQIAPPKPQSFQPLPCPVILPQRRPKDKTRGFVRAYAPVLGECAGIDQKTFMDFLKEFDRASRASPVFTVINVAAMIAGSVPSPIAMGVSIAVQVASRTGQEIQSRQRRNTYLDQINESLFKPRGLFCMIMTFKPDSPWEPVMGVDFSTARSTSDQALVKATSTPESDFAAKFKNLRLASGVAKGEMSLPESAPLIYPALDAAAVAALDGSAPTEKKQTALKSSSKFLSSYLDRRAQATYAGTHPESQLASAAPPPEKKFASRFSDPNHPINSGSIVSLLTGGHFDPHAKKRAYKAQRRARRRGYELSETDLKNAEMDRLPRRRQGVIRRVLQQDVLYLTIVNLPSESEMKEMLQQLETMTSQSSQ